jgi:hypothetical protein
MDHVLITRIIILLIVVAVAGWDFYLFWQIHWNGIEHAQDATFSVILYESARRWPVIPFVLGFLCGHVFWQVYSRSL